MRNFYYGSDDGYDYAKDNRNGEVDSYVEWVMELKRKEKEEKEMNTPKNWGVDLNPCGVSTYDEKSPDFVT